MKRLFALAAVALVGATTAFLPVPVSARESRKNQAHFYYLLPSSLSRDIANKGMIRNVVIDGFSLNFTHKNHSGRAPSKYAIPIWVGFGHAPKETISVINTVAYKDHLARNGKKKSRPALVETASARPVFVAQTRNAYKKKFFG